MNYLKQHHKRYSMVLIVISASGWGAVVYVVEKNKITVRELKGRQD